MLDRYGHLQPGLEDKVNSALDDMANDALEGRPNLRLIHDRERVSLDSRDIRAMDSGERETAANQEAADQHKRGGRYWIRTSDLCDVNAAL